MSVTDPAQEYFKDGLWGWNSTDGTWVKLPVDNDGYLRVSTALADLSGITFVVAVADSALSAELVLGDSIIMSGTAAAKPAASLSGRVYFETDTLKLFRDTGLTWTEISVKEADELKATGITDNWVLTADGAGESAFEVIPTQGVFNAYVCVRDKKSIGTASGTFTAGAWRIRTINEEQADYQNICSVANPQVTLDAGTYVCSIKALVKEVDIHQAMLYNVTGAEVLLLSLCGQTSTDSPSNGCAFISGQFTLAVQSALDIRHLCETTSEDDGYGGACGYTDEIYLIAEFWRLQ